MATNEHERAARHLRITEPSAWVRRFAAQIPTDGGVLDLACGGGRHARLCLDLGYSVLAVDKDTEAIRERLGARSGLTIEEIDLETGAPPFVKGGPLANRSFAGVVVVNYLWRPLLDDLVASLVPGGVLIYETFARGNEAFGKPRDPGHLLAAGELLNLCAGRLHVVAYEHGLDETGELPGVKQRVCAVKSDELAPYFALNSQI